MKGTKTRRRLSAERRQALQFLASSQSGLTEVLLFAHGVSPHMLGRLLRNGLATIQRESIMSGDQTIEIGCIKITDAGREALREREGHGRNSRFRPRG